MKQPPIHIEFLDSIRGFAIISVFLFHLLGAVCGVSHLPWGSWCREFSVPSSFLVLLPLTFGWCGVPIFFVVSGFCIHLAFRRTPSWTEFFVRRAFRIYPPYFFAVLLFAFVVPWTRIDFSFSGAAQLVTHLALIHNFDARTYFGINVAFWSVAVEVQLYLLYPLVVFFVGRFGWKRFLCYAGALEVGIRAIASACLVRFGEIPLWLYGIPFMYWFSWSLGAWIAECHISRRTIPFCNQSALLWGAAAVGSTFFKISDPFSFMLFAIATGVVVSNLLDGKPLGFRLPLLFASQLRQAGVLSYSIYLLHAPVLYVACAPALAAYISTKLPGGFPLSVVTLAVCLGFWLPVLVASRMWFKFIEIPSIRIGKRVATALRRADTGAYLDQDRRGLPTPTSH